MQSNGSIIKFLNEHNQRDSSNIQNENENTSNTIHVSNSEENEGITRSDDNNQESHTSSISNSETNDEFTIFSDDDNESRKDNWRAI